jgi:von Willebrand factor type A domain
MISPRRVPAALALLSLLLPVSPAHGSKPRLRLEQIDSRRCSSEGLIDLFVAELELEGSLRRPSTSQIRLVVDGTLLTATPVKATTFAKSDHALHLALVIQTSGLSKEDLGRVVRGVRDLLQALPRKSRVTVIIYSWQVQRLITRGRPRQALALLGDIAAANVAVDPALTESIKAGLRALQQPKPGLRRLLVVFSDGANQSPKRDLFRGLGSRARSRGVTIHPISFSSIDERGPLLNLGEIAKRTNGTLRWARRSADIAGQFLALSREINEQLVLTFKVPDRCALRHTVQVTSGLLRSRGAVIKALRPHQEQRAARWSGWKYVFIACVPLLMLLLVLITRWMIRGKTDAR